MQVGCDVLGCCTLFLCFSFLCKPLLEIDGAYSLKALRGRLQSFAGAVAKDRHDGRPNIMLRDKEREPRPRI